MSLQNLLRSIIPVNVKTPKSYRMLSGKGGKGEIYLYGNIGQSFWSDGISATQFKEDLKALGDVTQIDIRINSEGGDVFDGRTIYSLLAQHKAKKTVYVDGLAASIASLIAMVGSEIVMADGAFMMIHNAWGVAIGDHREMEKMSALLQEVSSSVANTYAVRTGQDLKQVKKWMDDETWMEASEALANGFATKVTEPVRAAAMVRVTRAEMYKNLPKSLRPRRAAALALIAAHTK